MRVLGAEGTTGLQGEFTAGLTRRWRSGYSAFNWPWDRQLWEEGDGNSIGQGEEPSCELVATRPQLAPPGCWNSAAP